MLRTILIASFALFTTGACFCRTDPGEGDKVGQIVALRKVGMLCKTWEAQLIRGGLTDGSGALGAAPFHFTIENDSLAQVAQGLMQNQTEVLLRYRTEGLSSFCRSETESSGDFAVSIAPARPPKP